MNTEVIARYVIIASLVLPLVVIASAVMTAESAFAQNGASASAGSNGGNNGGGRDASPEGASSALDLALDPDCFTTTHCTRKPRRPKRPRPVESASIAPDCSCEMRMVRSGGKFIRVKDCYKIVNNRLRYCEPFAQ